MLNLHKKNMYKWLAPIGVLSFFTPLLAVACGSESPSGPTGHNDPSIFKHLDQSFDLTKLAPLKLRKAKVESWGDGDTPKMHWLDDPSKQLKVRISGIDTPETHTQGDDGWVDTSGEEKIWGDRATAFAEKLIPNNTEVWMHDGGFDSHGRTVGSLFYGEKDGKVKSFSIGMIYAGYAMPLVNQVTDVMLDHKPLHHIGLSLADSYNYAYEKQINLFGNLHVLKEHGIPSDVAIRYRTNRAPEDTANLYDLWEKWGAK